MLLDFSGRTETGNSKLISLILFLLLLTFRTDSNGGNSVMTQPWAQWEPRLYDYAGYAISSGSKIITSLKAALKSDNVFDQV